jgi:DNA-binding transcriptional regulator YiaG
MGADEARAWLEENSNTETIDKYFGDEIERDDRETPELATEMRALRERMSATQEAFAGQLGVSSNSVARWERGEVPVPEPVIRLARLLSTFVK